METERRTQPIMLLLLVLFGVLACPVHCATVLFDGRVAAGLTATDFDADRTPFNAKFVHGQNQTWAGILEVGAVPVSMFDIAGKTQSVMLTLTDNSIFVPNPATVQTGFRRSELLPKAAATTLMAGTTTFHFSLRTARGSPLNLLHEYQLVFIEPTDGTHVFEVKYGTAYINGAAPTTPAANANQLRLMGSSVAGAAKVLFSTDFSPDVYQNFAVTIDWNAATLTAYHSAGNTALKKVVAAVPNAVTSGGEFHAGMVKLPIGPTNSVVFDGIQDRGIRESLVYAGIFVEDSANGAPVALTAP